jgi:hypothetical protein
LLAVFILAASASSGTATARFTYQQLDVSLPPFSLRSGERIVQYRCELMQNLLTRLKTPFGWTMEIDNASAHVTAKTVYGVSALTQNDLGFFEQFLTVNKENDVPLEINVSLGITDNANETVTRTLRFSTSELKLTPIP